MKTVFKATLILGLSVLASSAAVASPEVHAAAAQKLTFPSGDYSFEMTMTGPAGKKRTTSEAVKVVNKNGVIKITDPKVPKMLITGKIVKDVFTSESRMNGMSLKCTGTLKKGSIVTGTLKVFTPDGTPVMGGTFKITPAKK